MITSIHIKNMRCFQDFTLENIGQINLISGENNVGKTTLLEAIFILFACYRPNVFLEMLTIRGVYTASFTSALLWEHFFYKLTQEELEVQCAFGDDTLSLSLYKDTQYSSVAMFIQDQQSIPLRFEGHPLRLIFKTNNSENTGHCFLHENGLSTRWKNAYVDMGQHISYIRPGNTLQPNVLAELFSGVELAGKKEDLLRALRLLDNSIEDIFVMMQKSFACIYARQNGTSLPLNTKGDGINKLLYILCSMLAQQGGIFLIDEIENGFHYSFYPTLWQTIASVARSTGGQVFATTHSYECIQDAVHNLQNSHTEDTFFRYMRLGKHNDIITPHVLTNEVLTYAIAQDMEVR